MQEFLCPISRHCDKVQDGQPMKRSSILDRSNGILFCYEASRPAVCRTRPPV